MTSHIRPKTQSLAFLLATLLAGCVDQPIGMQTVYNDSYANNQNYNSGYDPSPQGGYDNRYDNNYNNAYNGPNYNDPGYNNQYTPQYNSGPEVSFNYFHDRLAPYGNWRSHPRWGFVWRPDRVANFRPYFNGYWSNTREYGWLWVSNDPWGDIPYRYGRWVYDPYDGWLWVPGYVWAPSWVVWRSGGGNIGWFPMPPDDYYGNGPYRGSFETAYGYRDWYGPSFSNDTFLSLWIVVGEDHFGDRNYRSYVARPRDHRTILERTSESTNYVTVNNYIVNRSVDTNRLERDTKRRFEPVPARDLVGRDTRITPVTAGRDIERRERADHSQPGDLRPAPVYVDPSARGQNAPQDANRGDQRDFQGRGGRGQPNGFAPNQPPGQVQQSQTPPPGLDRQQGPGFPGRGNGPPNDRFTRTPANDQVPQVSGPPTRNDGQPGRGLGRAFRDPSANNPPPNAQVVPVVPPPTPPAAQVPPTSQGPVQNAVQQPNRGFLGRGGARVPAAERSNQGNGAQNNSKAPTQGDTPDRRGRGRGDRDRDADK